MNKLGRRNYVLIANAVNTVGTYDPNEILYLFEEDLYTHEYREIIAFLKWCHENQKHFGFGNYEERFYEFKRAQA